MELTSAREVLGEQQIPSHMNKATCVEEFPEGQIGRVTYQGWEELICDSLLSTPVDFVV